jgi:hypothetical protein
MLNAFAGVKIATIDHLASPHATITVRSLFELRSTASQHGFQSVRRPNRRDNLTR